MVFLEKLPPLYIRTMLDTGVNPRTPLVLPPTEHCTNVKYRRITKEVFDSLGNPQGNEATRQLPQVRSPHKA